METGTLFDNFDIINNLELQIENEISNKTKTNKKFNLSINLEKKQFPNYEIDVLETDKNDLANVKSKLDQFYDTPQKSKITQFILRRLDPYLSFKYDLYYKYDAQNVTNAWLKCYEILASVQVEKNLLIMDYLLKNKKGKIKTFHNAELPGSFILATNHYLKSKHPNIEYDWYASSLIKNNINDKSTSSTILKDTFQIYKRNKNRWYFSWQFSENEEEIGDVKDLIFQKNVKNYFKNSVDLYTSDLGFDVSSDYNGQEKLHAHTNLGQIISGLLTLRKGGVMITKQYMFYETFTINLFYLLTFLFDKLLLKKPYTSRSGNSEIYLIGIGFRGISEKNSDLEENLLWQLENFSLKPFFAEKIIKNDKLFLEKILEISEQYTDRNCFFLEYYIRKIVKYSKEISSFSDITYNKFYKKINNDGEIQFYRNECVKRLIDIMDKKIKKLNPNDRINCVQKHPFNKYHKYD